MNIALDTNIWIYLTKDTFFKLWMKFKEMKESGGIKVIVNDTILKEWVRNKPKTIKTLTNNIENEYKSALNLSNYLEGDAKANYLQTISEYKDKANRIKKAEERVEELEAFMKSCTIIQTTEAQKLFIAELSINKNPPFQNNKNNFNDALILRNICEYVDNEVPALYDLIYVSNNPDDFIDTTKNEVYADLLHGLKPIRLKNVKELGEALKLAPELIEDFDEWLEIQLDNQAMYELGIMRGK
jgi:predicted nucleic acid-binding protein